MESFSYPPKPRPGDRVAVVSPSAGLPAIFSHMYELGLRRLREEFGLEPVEYPTTRALGADPRDRARDVDLGNTDPQQIVPYRGEVVVDAVDRRISVRY